MEAAFWISKWERNEIGFHVPEVSAYLTRNWVSLELAAGSRVLVPLCGKTLDMVWLAEQGYQVVGIELSQVAVESFFAEQGLSPMQEKRGDLVLYKAGPYEIVQGDFFKVGAEQVAACAGFYDRAALIALPENMRPSYVKQMGRLMPAKAKGLLVTLEYDQDKRAGPPFSVSEHELHALYGSAWGLTCLERNDVLAENAKFARQGVIRLDEVVHRISR
ncbi:thiopurine S-methyltransferase [Pseudomonas luteola]|uniref:thiopurine S-methyltransferase n=1 Tax=Pseudomonas TaxID=286 RepID=UPI003DA1857D